jgi:hypothetical protein
MVEALMYLGIGFLFATLIAVSVIPLIHGRAVRLTTRRIENSIPQSMAEIQADKDLQRADSAVSTRRLEITIEQLKESNTSQRAEIGKKDDIINRFKVEREAQNVELLLLKTEVGALKQQIGASDIRLNIEQDHPHELASLSTVPADSPRPEVASTHLISPQVRMQHDRFPRAALLATRYEGAGSVAEPMLAQKRTALNDQNDRSDTPLAASGLVEGAAARADDSTAEISADGRKPIGREAMSASRSEPSIHVSPSDHFVQERARQGIQLGAVALIAALIGIAVFVWAYREDASGTITAWTQAIIPLPPSTAGMPAPKPEEKAASPPLAQQLDDLTREVADTRNNVQQFAVKQEQLNHNTEPARSEQETKEARLNPTPQAPPKLAPVRKLRRQRSGWIVHEVANGTAVVQGPNGIWRVARGDVLPGAGRVDSIVRWGNRWIVATNRGLISTP